MELKKSEWPLEGKCRLKNIVHKCIKKITGHTQRTYPEIKLYYIQKMSFTNEFHASYTSLSNYVCEMKEKYNISPVLKWSLPKTYPITRIFWRNVCCDVWEIWDVEMLNFTKKEKLFNKQIKL